jgi:hypothetical protein
MLGEKNKTAKLYIHWKSVLDDTEEEYADEMSERYGRHHELIHSYELYILQVAMDFLLFT